MHNRCSGAKGSLCKAVLYAVYAYVQLIIEVKSSFNIDDSSSVNILRSGILETWCLWMEMLML